ncbi:MAG: hypothetical protein ABWZ16_07135 [Microbacterium sp.]
MTTDTTRTMMPTESPARGIGRRQLMKAGAWAAPALLVTVAAPAAMASSSLSKAAIEAPTPGARFGGPNTATIDFAAVSYKYGNWGLTGDNSQTDGPSTATVTWRVALKNASGAVFAYFPIGAGGATSRTDAIAKYSQSQVGNISLTGVPAGTYTVVTEMVSVTYAPNPVKGVTFSSSPFSSGATAVTVKNTW